MSFRIFARQVYWAWLGWSYLFFLTASVELCFDAVAESMLVGKQCFGSVVAQSLETISGFLSFFLCLLHPASWLGVGKGLKGDPTRTVVSS